MDMKLLQKVDEVRFTNNLVELNNLVTKEDWILLAVITSPTENKAIYHIGHLNIKDC